LLRNRATAGRPYNVMGSDHTEVRRQSLRLKDYDYASAGRIFRTICMRGHLPLLGDVVEGCMQLTDYGRIVWQEWQFQ
jgi:hypothetical protein